VVALSQAVGQSVIGATFATRSPRTIEPGTKIACKHRGRVRVFGVATLMLAASAWAAEYQDRLSIPAVATSAKRLVTIDDVIAIRQVDTLSVSPDGQRFAILVRQANAAANSYRVAWFVGSVAGGPLTYVGDGGEVRPRVEANGYLGGEIDRSEARWSRDGQWLAYKLRRNGEVQLWRSHVNGGDQQRLTRSKADVIDFAWKPDGRTLYFTVGQSRMELRRQVDAKMREGYQYNEDLYQFTDFMKPQMGPLLRADGTVWTVTVDASDERIATASEREEFAREQSDHLAGLETATGSLQDAAVPPVRRADGGLAWLVRSAPSSSNLRVMVATPEIGADSISCAAEQCAGAINRVWWSEDGQHVVIWRGEGINGSSQAFYSWSPSTRTMKTIHRALDDSLRSCERAGDSLVCIRETPTRPVHLASISLQSGSLKVVADVNPEFTNVRLGKIERIEWQTPKLSWNEPGGQLAGLYPKQAYGRILYPPDFDPSRTYPVFVEPYVANGFNSSVGSEHALQVYAAHGIVVLNLAFPGPIDVFARLGPAMMKELYSADLGFPHLTMLAESTLGGLDAVAARGFIDGHRVGIGGVSHGSFVPLYMMLTHSRIAAISISSPTWGPHEYYWATRKGRAWLVEDNGKVGYEDWRVKPEGEGQRFWSQFDIADHVGTIEAPILMQLSAHEVYGLLRLLRHLDDAGRPYDAYVFANETHIKWQPAHLHSIMRRNLDWFRFWLQDHEDVAPGKMEQYWRWRKLRERRDELPPIFSRAESGSTE
jgi:dipeptidyl aminopeptidase/acylaminoacyl peptidase